MNHTEIVLEEWRLLESLIDGKGASPITLSGRTLSIAEIISVSRHNASVDISPSAIASMGRSVDALGKRLQDGEVIYGVNTGFGGDASVRTKKFVALQRALIREFHYGVLPVGERDHSTGSLDGSVGKHRHDLTIDSCDDTSYLPWSWARAAILVRINSLISGCSAIRPVIVERMQDLLKHEIIPLIPLRGSISASGDLSPLSYICGAVQGKPTIRVFSKGGGQLYADTAFRNANLEPVALGAKEGLAVINGTAVSTAAAALALHDTHSLAVMGQILTAMSVEALNGTEESFSPFFSKVRPHPGQTEAARNILAFLEGSKLTKVNDGAGSTLRQDRYSLRTVPQWIGPILEDLVLAHKQISVECNSTTDNPLATQEGEFLHGGNFQAKSVTSAMEKARQGIQGIGRMIFCQCTEIINPVTNRGLPPNLVAEDPSSSLIFKGTDLNIAALTAELGFLASPVNHVQTAEMANQSLNSLALISTRYTHTANEVLSQLMAAHLIAVCQALDLRAMHVQFIELYRPRFFELVAEHYGDLERSNLRPSKPAAADELSELMWSELLKSFDTTANMDADERFVSIAKSLRTIVLDHRNFNRDAEFVSRQERFTDALSSSLHDAWCAQRDAYLVHGDASPLLGKASKAVYTFLRRTLNVPLLATRHLMTPKLDVSEGGLGARGAQAPTVGSYTGAVSRALRDGTLAKVAADVLAGVV
ncbi:phenylalanine and histidine ammonia-lyase [Durotheca rogersii]|uniref:phenylalanine and histidine ammonia-lyase n=1 Tax=Durotheca rogersii TaxID=419775 RepID=UPI002220C60D|nr:phenylalanine and histidine ammonia-lyase [Durotheca rogersii]KAI5859563.1 phenylalanine and histidine ammonia-lyase [Durotheca rogersii]